MRLPVLGEARDQLAEEVFIRFVEGVFGGPKAGGNDLIVAERARHGGHAGAGEFQAVEPEDNFAGRFDVDFTLVRGGFYACDRCGEAAMCSGDVDGADQGVTMLPELSQSEGAQVSARSSSS